MADFILAQTGAELQTLINKIAPTEEKVTQLSAEVGEKFLTLTGTAKIDIPASSNGRYYYAFPKLNRGETYTITVELKYASGNAIYWALRGDGTNLFAYRVINPGDLSSVLTYTIPEEYAEWEIEIYCGIAIPAISVIISSQASSLNDLKDGIDDVINQVGELTNSIEDNESAIEQLNQKVIKPTTRVTSHNIYNPAKAENGHYYRWNDGVKVERSDIASTGLIPCKGGDNVYVFRYTAKYGGNVTYWDKNGNYISGQDVAAGGDVTTPSFTIPSNSDIAYFRTSFYNTIIDSLCVNINEKYDDDVYKEETAYWMDLPLHAPNIPLDINATVGELTEKIQEVDDNAEQALKDIKDLSENVIKPTTRVVSHNVYNPAKAENGHYYQWFNGAIIERSDIASTGLIPCKAGDVIYVFRYNTYYGGNVTYWDKDGNYISGENASTSPFTVPNNDNIAFFRTSFYNTIIDSLCVNINEKYDDDVFKEETAYWVDLPLHAPNLQEKDSDKGVAKYYSMVRDSVTSIYGRNLDIETSFIFSIIAKKNYEDTPIRPRLKATSDTSELGDDNCTSVLVYAKKNEYQHVINAGIFLTAANEADGTTIMNGEILKDGACEQFAVNQYVLGITSDGSMKAYRGVSAQEIIDDGCVDAVMGFVPLLENGNIVDDSVISICPHWNIRHPRQIVGILSTGDYFTFCCDGRTDGENGMTLKECISTLCDLAVIAFAFNLDGGGSTQTVTYHKEVNRRLDGRKVPNVIVFMSE